jgi:hypothetical protein
MHCMYSLVGGFRGVGGRRGGVDILAEMHSGHMITNERLPCAVKQQGLTA